MKIENINVINQIQPYNKYSRYYWQYEGKNNVSLSYLSIYSYNDQN